MESCTVRVCSLHFNGPATAFPPLYKKRKVQKISIAVSHARAERLVPRPLRQCICTARRKLSHVSSQLVRQRVDGHRSPVQVHAQKC